MIITSIVLGIGASVAAAITVAATIPEPEMPELALAAPALVAERTAASSTTATEDAPPRASDTLHWVIDVGGKRYVVFQQLDAEHLPAHGTPRLLDKDGEVAVIAPVAKADSPGDHTTIDQVRLDGGCIAEVGDYAIISRLVGDTGYAGDVGETWTTDNVMRTGSTVLAARITGCAKGTFGRDADLPAIVELEQRTDEALADAARSALLASDAARTTQSQWRENGGEGDWHEHSTLDAKVLRHPTTGVTWVAVHGNFSEMGCGGPGANVWGLFRVAKDGSLVTVEARVLETLHSITDVIDIDRDGTPELVGSDWLGMDRILTRADGDTVVQHLDMPFYGCPC